MFASSDFCARPATSTAPVPLIALTAYAGAEAREAALAAGFHHCMRKPFEPMALAALLASLIAEGDSKS